MNYCKLYVDSKNDASAMESMLNVGVMMFFDPFAIECVFFINEVYIPDASVDSKTFPIDRSRYYVELDTEPDAGVSEDEFKLRVSKLIIWLRERSDFVIASCDFEDYVAEVTGWNWTPEQPMPQNIRKT
ncbi:hypothetical protein [Achromobacter pestifer]